MKIIRRAGELLAALFMGIAVMAVFFLGFFLPRRKKQEQQAAQKRADDARAAAAKAQAVRAAKVDQAVAEVKVKADAQKAQDSVALANKLLEED
jgi:hypothetical protein